jgi:rod shape-determining protein MreB
MLLRTHLYVQVLVDRVCVRLLGASSAAEQHASAPFSHPRMLLGTFTAARDLLIPLVKQHSGSWLTRDLRRIHVLMHPMERMDGGLSEIERRAFRELGFAIGARHVVLWIGKPLSSDEALEVLRRRRDSTD